MDDDALREKTTKSIRQLREDIARRWDNVWLERLEADHVLEHDRYNLNRFKIAGSCLLLERKDDRWWIRTERFGCVLESFDGTIRDFWPLLDLPRLFARGAALDAPPYKPLQEDEVEEGLDYICEWREGDC